MPNSDRRLGITATQLGCSFRQRATAVLWMARLFDCGVRWMDNGDCVGGDKELGELWKAMGGKLHLRPCTIAGKRAGLAGDVIDPPLPPLARNRTIAAADALIAAPKGFAEELRSGTWATVRYARALGRPILIIWPDGTVAKERWHPAQGTEARRAETP